MTKFAKIENGVVDVISPSQPVNRVEKDVEVEQPLMVDDGTYTTQKVTRKVTELVPDTDWIEIPDDVFTGFTQKSDGSFEAPPAPMPTEEDVRNESGRRLQLIFGARDQNHLTILINDALRAGLKLLSIGESNWTDEQKSRNLVLNQSNNLVDAFDDASKALRGMPEIPADFAHDKNWPDYPNAGE